MLTEALCYSGLRNLAARVGLHLEPVAIDEDGILPEALAAAARQRGAKLLITSPNLHNPTAILTPLARREAIAAVARELDLQLVEDDVYGPLLPERPPALAALAPERTLYLTSVSKFLAPGLRLGIVHGPNSLVRPLVAAQRELSLGLAPFSGELFARAHKAGLLTLARASSASRCASAKQMAARLLDGLELQTQPFALHMWLHLPTRWSSAEAALALARTGVLVTPAELFFIGRGAAPRALRISLAGPPTQPICAAPWG